ncbi:hypothetical protein, partial [Rhodococcus yananensis]|uniref:hypothetical protein n=1 Tax=Rhodococcus yananensis TaxID=2879464 RepID=UPI001CF92A99
WADVVAELTVDDGGLTKSQKAWLALVKPITLTQGFALLSGPPETRTGGEGAIAGPCAAHRPCGWFRR